ncbi:four helix bundle protein [Candidatus Wolfebacteria bacterium]|nr:four helix bundle protein [Candidatus Wolfebacteria bacterium]
MINSYKDLIVWQKSIELVVEIYHLTNLFPKSEIYGLTNQMRRSAVSISSNIAEGYSRKHRQEYIQFIRIAFGSGAELETQIIIAKRLKLASSDKFNKSEALLNEVMKMLNKLNSSLVAKS